MLNWWEMNPREAIFTWENPDTGEQLHIATDRLNALARESNIEPILMAIDPAHAEAMPDIRDLEQHRLDALGDDPDAWPPVLVCMTAEKDGVVADGNHRYHKAWKLGRTEIRAWLCPPEVWTQFLVNLPRISSLKGYSGL